MKRRLLNLLTALSLLAAVATATAWARGHATGDVFRYITGGASRAEQTVWAVAGGGGGLALVAIHGAGIDFNPPGDGLPSGFNWHTTPPRYGAIAWPGDSAFNRAGFYRLNMPGNGNARSIGVYGMVVPAWFVFVLTAALPVARGAARLRRRHVPGTCRRCGYDLRARAGVPSAALRRTTIA